VLDALERILERVEEPDDALRAAVALLADEPGVRWAGITFLDHGILVLGPAAGKPDDARRTRVPIDFQGSSVGELWVDGAADTGVLEQIALRLSGHVLIGWDTRGDTWDP
jgi:putative methionine-R-sulfoxide reductase with GAF domain